MDIRNSIRRLRFEQGEMTQQELADSVGVTRQTINAIELGKYSPSLEVAFRIARVFKATVEQVFQYGEERQAHTAARQPLAAFSTRQRRR